MSASVSLSDFKNQVGCMLRSINHLGSPERTEALCYLQQCIADQSIKKYTNPDGNTLVRSDNNHIRPDMQMNQFIKTEDYDKRNYMNVEPHKYQNEHNKYFDNKLPMEYNVHSYDYLNEIPKQNDYQNQYYQSVVKSNNPELESPSVSSHSHVNGHSSVNMVETSNTTNLKANVLDDKNNSSNFNKKSSIPISPKSKNIKKSSKKPSTTKINNKSTKSVQDNNINLICSYKFCNKVFHDKTLFMEHFETHFDFPLSCRSCRKEFTCLEGFTYHKNLGLCENSNSSCDNHNKSADDTSTEIFSCEPCGISFSRKQNMDNHFRHHDKYKCKDCSKTFPSQSLARVHRQETALAAKKLAQTEAGKQDILNNTNITTSNPLYKVEGHDVEGAVLQCPICPRTFYRNSRRKDHIQKHAENLLIICKECSMGYHSKILFEKHLRDSGHSNDSNKEKKSPALEFVCELCGKKYVRRSSLQQHMKRCHNKVNDFSCSLCDYVTNTKGNLDRHVALHTSSEESSRQVVCDQCGAGFLSGTALKEHVIYIHNQEREFPCTDCDKTFKVKPALSRHMVSCHSEDRPFTCSICPQAYKRSSHLRRHQQSAHGGEEGAAGLEKSRKVQRMVTNETGELVPVPDEKKTSVKKSSPKVLRPETAATGIDNNKLSTSSMSDVSSLTDETGSNNQLFSLMDVHSGELVTLSVAEMSKNSVIKNVIDISSHGDLLQTVQMPYQELWPPADPQHLHHLNMVPQNSYMMRPHSQASSSSIMSTTTKPTSSMGGYVSSLDMVPSAGQMLVSPDQSGSPYLSDGSTTHTLMDISNTFLRSSDVQQMHQTMSRDLVNVAGLDETLQLNTFQGPKTDHDCPEMVMMTDPGMQYDHSLSHPHSMDHHSDLSMSKPSGSELDNSSLLLTDYLQNPFQFL